MRQATPPYGMPRWHWAVAEARLRGATLHVVHAREAVQPQAPYASANSRLAGIDDPGRACGLLEDALTMVFGPELPGQVTAELAAGRPEAVLVRYSASADLLVLGSTAAAHEAGVPFGPVPRGCLRAGRCPVVTIAVPSNLRHSYLVGTKTMCASARTARRRG